MYRNYADRKYTLKIIENSSLHCVDLCCMIKLTKRRHHGIQVHHDSSKGKGVQQNQGVSQEELFHRVKYILALAVP